MSCGRIVLIVLCAFGVICIIVGVVLGFAALPNVLIRTIDEGVRLENGTVQFDRWVEAPFDLTVKIYFFHISNPKDVITGAKPDLEEKGPYVYRQTRRKRDIKIDETEDTIFYYEDRFLYFDAELSGELSDEDSIMTLNAPLMGIFQMAEGSDDPTLLSMINDQWRNAFNEMDLFDEFRVKDYLFNGINFCDNDENSEDLCNFIGKQLESVRTLEMPEDQSSISFAFLRHKIDADESYLIRTGIEEIEKIGKILEWNEIDNLDMWGKEGECNKLRGRDIRIFPPHATDEYMFDVFQSDICRVVTFNYVDEEEHSSRIIGYRQELVNETLSNEGDQECFCSKITKDINGYNDCWPDGFMDLSPCKSPHIIMSFPHFLNADEEFASTVDGLTPSPEEHSTFVVFEPNTGTTLRRANRIQYNMVLRPIKDVKITTYLEGAVLPLLWIEEEMELPQNLVNELRQRYFDQVVIVDVLTWVLIGFGIALTIGGGIFIFIC